MRHRVSSLTSIIVGFGVILALTSFLAITDWFVERFGPWAAYTFGWVPQ
jgi:hypothetical protein